MRTGAVGRADRIDEVNQGGGIKGMDGAKIDMVFGNARSTPDGDVAEVERMQADGVCAVVGGFASPICLAASQAARYDLSVLSLQRLATLMGSELVEAADALPACLSCLVVRPHWHLRR